MKNGPKAAALLCIAAALACASGAKGAGRRALPASTSLKEIGLTSSEITSIGNLPQSRGDLPANPSRTIAERSE
jgi:hypothetical protein